VNPTLKLSRLTANASSINENVNTGVAPSHPKAKIVYGGSYSNVNF